MDALYDVSASLPAPSPLRLCCYFVSFPVILILHLEFHRCFHIFVWWFIDCIGQLKAFYFTFYQLHFIDIDDGALLVVRVCCFIFIYIFVADVILVVVVLCAHPQARTLSHLHTHNTLAEERQETFCLSATLAFLTFGLNNLLLFLLLSLQAHLLIVNVICK